MNRILAIAFFIVFFYSGPAFAAPDNSCQRPYQPTNIFKLLLNYSATLDYITNAPESCQKPFKQEVTQLVRSTWMFSEGCKDATFEDFDEAQKKRDEKSEAKQDG